MNNTYINNNNNINYNMFDWLYNILSYIGDKIYFIFNDDNIVINNNQDLFHINNNDIDDYNKFISNDIIYSKTVFCLNSLSSVIFPIIFQYFQNVSLNNYVLQILDSQMYFNEFYKQNILNDLTNINIRFIYIRVTIKNNYSLFSKFNYINHVNCIIIDKQEKIIFIIEPKIKLKYRIDKIVNILCDNNKLDNFDIITLNDFGYQINKPIQKNDIFCQTYILLIFYLIVHYPDIKYNNYKDLFDLISKNTISKFLFIINKGIINETINIDFTDYPIIWGHSNNFIKKINRFYNYFKKRNHTYDNFQIADKYSISINNIDGDDFIQIDELY